MTPESVRELKFADAAKFDRAERNMRAQGYIRFERFATADADAPYGLRAYRDTAPERRLLGHLIWWSLAEETGLELAAVQESAAEARIPEWMQKAIRPMSPKVAFWRASQFSALGVPSARHNGEDEKSKSYFLTKRVGTDTALVRETVDQNGKLVKLQQCALLWLEGETDAVRFDLARPLSTDPAFYSLACEVQDVLNDVLNRTDQNRGKVHTWDIRTLVRSWLERNYRICLRGTGGVYFVPGTESEELVAVRNWVMSAPIDGSLSISEMWTGGANSTDDLATSAIAELESELAVLTTALDDKAKSARADRALSVKAEVKDAQNLLAKLDALEAVLGELGAMRAMLSGVVRRATDMAAESRTQVDAAREAAKAAKAQTRRAALPAADETSTATETETEVAPAPVKRSRKALAADVPVAEPTAA